MGKDAGKIVSVAGSQNTGLAIDSNLKPAFDDHRAFLALVRKRGATGLCTDCIFFYQHLKLAIPPLTRDEKVGNTVRAKVAHTAMGKKEAFVVLQLEAEEKTQIHINTGKDFLEERY